MFLPNAYNVTSRQALPHTFRACPASCSRSDVSCTPFWQQLCQIFAYRMCFDAELIITFCDALGAGHINAAVIW